MYDVYKLVCDVFHSLSDIPSLISSAGFPLICDLGCFLSHSRSSTALFCGVLCFIAVIYDEKIDCDGAVSLFLYLFDFHHSLFQCGKPDLRSQQKHRFEL